MARGSRLRQIGWVISIGVVFGGFMLLTFRVESVKSEVVQAERTIVALEREKRVLETEFQTRANQQQLANWNAIEFGYAPPRADQFLDHERQLVDFGAPRAPGAPPPIRFAREMSADDYPALISPLSEQGEDEGEVSATPTPAPTPEERLALARVTQ